MTTGQQGSLWTPTRLAGPRLPVRTITARSTEWPRLLDECGSPPERLFVQGRELGSDAAFIAIVGTRYPTVAGIEVAREMATAIAEAGFVVVSGLAVGIDAVAHRAALDAGGATVAVVGAGLDIDYPQRNRTLRSDIEQCGTIVSEYEEGTAPRPHHFPARNRIIAALSVATIVTEGGIGSGALITARCALEANRAVFAVPGSVRNAMAAGPNELIKRSEAVPLTTPADLFAEIAPHTAWGEPSEPSSSGLPGLEPDEFTVLARLDDIALLPDRLSEVASLEPGRIALVLARLEVRGLVAREGAGYRITSMGARLREAVLGDQAGSLGGRTTGD